MAEDLGERTEDATPRRRQDARQEGNVARSPDLAGAVVLLVVTAVLWAAGSTMLGQGTVLVGHALDPGSLGDPREGTAASDIGYVGAWGVRVATPILLITWAAAFVSHFMQIGWLFAPKSVQPQLSKLSPISGFKRIFGLRGLVKVTLDILKVAVVGIVSVPPPELLATSEVKEPTISAPSSLQHLHDLKK